MMLIDERGDALSHGGVSRMMFVRDELGNEVDMRNARWPIRLHDDDVEGDIFVASILPWLDDGSGKRIRSYE